MPAREKESYSIQSVENALDVLEALCEESDDVRISRLSEKLKMNKTSVFRLLATLENRGYVEREQDSGKYRLGLSAYEMGQKFLSRMGLLSKARPVMERLARQCNEAIYLVVGRGENVLFFDLIDTPQQVKIVSLTGKRYPLPATSAGKVLLAHMPEEDLALWRAHFQKKGEPFPADGEIQVIRQEGTCFDQGALGEGISSVSAPLFSAGGKLPGSLCVVGPEFRMTRKLVQDELDPFLKDAAQTISSKLGCFSPYLGREPS